MNATTFESVTTSVLIIAIGTAAGLAFNIEPLYGAAFAVLLVSVLNVVYWRLCGVPLREVYLE